MRDRQEGGATDIMTAGVSCVKCSILVCKKTHLAVCAPPLAIKAYSLGACDSSNGVPLQSPKGHVFVCTHSLASISTIVLCNLVQPEAKVHCLTLTYRHGKNCSKAIELFVILRLMFTLQTTAKSPPLWKKCTILFRRKKEPNGAFYSLLFCRGFILCHRKH